ncbi:MAG TPA: helix-turn-helix domain-containing protein [Sphingobium sp.]|uniref:winged helix-turn-helix transcriptional regulator n=1 Tax=Sphingobium sp. TaxID=1912891 RepID=UPI002ED3109A
MQWSGLAQENCSIARTISIIGDRWTMLILRDAFAGAKRFEEFQHGLGLSRAILTDRLSKLIDNFILTKIAYRQSPVRYEYQLTSKGEALFPIILTMAQWGDSYMRGPEGRPTLVVHLHCHTAIDARLVCPDCGEEVNSRSIEVFRGPASQDTALPTLPPSVKSGSPAIQIEIDKVRRTV